jgi:hypothetical protein
MNLPTIQDVQFIEADAFGSAMVERLRADLAVARWARWSVCYFTQTGLDALKPGLSRVLAHPLTQGLFTLTCACEAPALVNLARMVNLNPGRLRIFLPIGLTSQSQDVRLIHSKMVLIIRPRDPGAPSKGEVAVLYVGSHNWTGAAFRLKGVVGKNIEASLRIEGMWDSSHEDQWLRLAELGGQPQGNAILDAIRQMSVSFSLASNTDLALRTSAAELESWRRATCLGTVAPPGHTPLVVLTAVLEHGSLMQEGRRFFGGPDGNQVLAIPSVGEQIYVQHHRKQGEPETFDTSMSWAVLLWESLDDLKQTRVPWLLLCSMVNLGMENAGDFELRQFNWVAGDPGLNRIEGGQAHSRRPQSVTIQPNRRDPLEVQWWSMDMVPPNTSSRVVERMQSDRHILLRVQMVRAPQVRVMSTATPWLGTELPLHKGKNRSRQRYFLVCDDANQPSETRARAMVTEQVESFGLSPAPSDRAQPTGTKALTELDVYEVQALINELLFDATAKDQVFAQHEESERQVAFSLGEVNPRHKRLVPRMEKLIAPGAPYVCQALGIKVEESVALHFKKDTRFEESVALHFKKDTR